MCTVKIECPDEILISLKETPEEFKQEVSMAAAAKLYELGKLSSGRAAQLAGISRVSFLQALTKYGVSVFNLTPEDLKDDVTNA